MMLIEFWRPNCTYCKQISPVIDSIEKECGKKLKIRKVNTDESPDLAGIFKIKSVPTLVLMDSGRELRRMSGSKNRAAVMEFLGMA